MINFNVKNVGAHVNPATWFNEMLSMVAEDTIDAVIGVPTGDFAHPVSSRIPQFLADYAKVGVTEWSSGAAVFSNYAMAYAFGAYLARNFGGALLVDALMRSGGVDRAAIDDALASRGSSFDDALSRFGEVLVYRGSGVTGDLRSFDKTATETVRGTSYTFAAFDVATLGTVKFAEPHASAPIRPYGFTGHTFAGWQDVTGSVLIFLTKPISENVDFYLYVTPR
jgi:hypothetical protein